MNEGRQWVGVKVFIQARLLLGAPCRYAGRSDAGCLYELCVKLLSENEDVLAEYKTETIAIPEDNDASWTEVSDSCGFMQVTLNLHKPGMFSSRQKQEGLFWRKRRFYHGL